MANNFCIKLLMRTKLCTTLLFLLTINLVAQAQTRSTKEAKVILVVNDNNTKIIGLELFDEKEAAGLEQRHPGSNFYIGLLRGSYDLEKKRVIPNAGATIIIFTERKFFPNEELFPNEDFTPGNSLALGDAKTKIISNGKGELVLETQ